MNNQPSIFNDVIGPVMRGPSSSHCAAALRIGRIARDLMQSQINEACIKYDPNGSLVTTHELQGSDMGLYSGFLGYETDSPELITYKDEIAKSGIKIDVKYEAFGALHPNTYNIELRNTNHTHTLVAVSTGGGMIEIINIDGAPLSIDGGYYETLIYIINENPSLIEKITQLTGAEEILLCKGSKLFIEIKTIHPVNDEIINKLKTETNIENVIRINPVMPVLSGMNISLPFTDCEGMLEYNKDKNLSLWQLALEYESARGMISKDEVFEKMRNIVNIMYASIKNGLQGSEYKDRILPAQSPKYKKLLEAGKLPGGDLLNLTIMYVTAIMESKSSMGVIVAAPTAGSCGSVAGPVIAASQYFFDDEDTLVRAMLIAGLIGVFIASRSTFAAEDAGCQAECGSGSGMAAAAITFLYGGTVEQSLAAASLALQNCFGMTCDPIAGRVEAPCLGKNILAAVNAITCSNMAIAGYKHLIPLDEVIDAFDKAGRSLPRELRCTALGGLSVTKTSKEIEKRIMVH